MKATKRVGATEYVMFWLTPRDPTGYNPQKSLEKAKRNACRRQQIPPEAVELVHIPDTAGYLAACAKRVRTEKGRLTAYFGPWSKAVPASPPVDYGEQPIGGSAPPAVTTHKPRRKDPYKNRPLN